MIVPTWCSVRDETVPQARGGPADCAGLRDGFPIDAVFFIQDDHDYYDNDDAYDEIVTFPADGFMTEMARATQSLVLPGVPAGCDAPAGAGGFCARRTRLPISESFGTLRYGRLAEVLLYTVRRTLTMAGPSAVFLDPEVEGWLLAPDDVSRRHPCGERPSNPPGWTAGKWGEWFPDVLGADGRLTMDVAKPYWQAGWLGSTTA